VADVHVEGPAVERGEVAHRDALLAARATRRAEIAAGRDGEWLVPPPPPGLADRRVEFTGPTERVALADGFPDFLTLPAYELID
jgi:hypothetical protein